ncbi:MAG TPA: ABC transporter substrate-binding protein [Bryobacteraceae bacterium]|nr:ABC transporter substrate-binding protein [Bryobacteraceae bacterium]
MKPHQSNSARIFLVAVCVAGLLSASPAVAQEKTVKIGVVTFLSGAAAAPFGVPAKNAADLVVEAANAGKLPVPYTTKGMGGGAIELTFVDEAGGTTKQVTEYRNLVQRDVDLVIGYISSGDCLAIAPVAEELKKLTVFFDCGTPRIFEDASYKYVFRTGAMATMDNIALAMYVTQAKPNIKKIAGINQNYAWGQDSWNDFEASMKVLKPGVEVATAQWPQLLSGQYGAEISALLASGADVAHSSFWGGDLEAFILQASPRGLFTRSTVLLTCGETAVQKLGGQIPDGTVIGARGPFDMFAPDTPLNRWFRKAYQDKHGVPPTYPAYKMAQAILGVKSAYEKAKASNKGKAPNQDQVIAAFESLTFEGPGGTVQMSTGKGHQAVQGTAYGTVKHEKGQVTLVDVKTYPADKVTPPDGVKSEAWIKAGFKKPS